MYITASGFKKLTIFLIGLAIFSLGTLTVLAIVSFNPFDPSINNAISFDEIHNLGGKIGAFIADPLIQFFGYSGILYGLIFMSWGVHIILNSQRKWWILKVFSFIMLLAVLPGFLSALPLPEKFISMSGGGFIGIIILRYLTDFIDNSLFYAIFFALSFLFMIFALGIKPRKILNFTLLSFKIVRFIFAKLINLIRFNKVPQNEHMFIDNMESDNLFEIENDINESHELKENSKVNKLLQRKSSRKEIVKSVIKNESEKYTLPTSEYLIKPQQQTVKISSSFLQEQVNLLEQVLQDFGIKGQIMQVKPGPVVTLFELEPAAGTKSSRIIGLADDIARSMSALSARIAVIAGKNLIGIELPNKTRETVYLRELIESDQFKDNNIKLPIALGKNIGGETVVVDLTKMPHLLVAGTTGSGKSVAINAMILSFIYRLTPEECKFIMIDPKMLELSVYDGIPHLLCPVVTEPAKAIVALKWVVKEMENRYRLMSHLGVRNFAGFNEKIEEAKKNNKVLTRNVQTGFDTETGKPIFETLEIENKKLPFIVVIVDEMADLMLVAGKEIEASIQRLAQMARAAGIHIIMATQRPSVDVITGVIKANFPTRISFQVTSKIDSRTILGDQGAEQLLGMGDMLYMSGGGKITRVHAPFVGDNEVEKVVNHLKEQSTPNYIEDITKVEDEESEESNFKVDSGDKLYDEAVAIILRDKKASISYLQRCLKIGYNRAATLIEKMEKEGIVGAPNHVGKREILVQGNYHE